MSRVTAGPALFGFLARGPRLPHVHSHPRPLTADDLNHLLARCEAATEAFEEQDFDSREAADAAQAQLQQNLRHILQPLAERPIEPQDLEQLDELGRYLDRCGLDALHLQLITTHAPGLWQHLPPDAQYLARIRHGFSVARLSPDTRASLQALAEAIASVPAVDQDMAAWASLADLAEGAQHYDLQRHYLHQGQAAINAQPTYTAWERAHEAATYHLKLAESHRAEGQDLAAAQAHAAQALDALAEFASRSPDINHAAWLEIAERILEINPNLYERLAQSLRASLPADLSPALRRSVEVLLARLHAPLLYAQGQLDEAIRAGLQGLYGLSSDDHYAVPAVYRQLPEWLQEAGRHDEALNLHVDYAGRMQSHSEASLAHIQECVAQGQPPRADLPLTLLEALVFAPDELAWLHPGEKRHAFAQRMLQLARQWEPGSPLADLMEGFYLSTTNHENRRDIFARALPLLERGAQGAPQNFSHHHALELLAARLFVHGLEAGFAQAFVPIVAGLWAYNLGCQLDDGDPIAERTRQLGPWPQALANQLAEQLYETGLAHFERFFATGQGHYRDACAHTYAMLCNNLGIRLRYQAFDLPKGDAQRHALLERALSLHRKGIAASPFAENYDGVVICLYNMDGDHHEEHLKAAEALWQFADEHGYSRYDLCRAIYRVALSLEKVDRPAEIARWLPRLQQWWDSLDADEQADPDTHRRYLNTLSMCLDNWSMSRPQDALARLHIDLPAMHAHGDAETVLYAAQVLRRAGRHAEALPLYELSLQRHGPSDTQHLLEFAQARRQDCLQEMEQAAAQARRPWWKLW